MYDRLNCNERVHPYPLNDRAAAYKRERECVCGVVGWLRMEGEVWMRHCLTKKKKRIKRKRLQSPYIPEPIE